MLGFDHSASKPKTSSGESRIITGHVGDFHPQLCPKSLKYILFIVCVKIFPENKYKMVGLLCFFTIIFSAVCYLLRFDGSRYYSAFCFTFGVFLCNIQYDINELQKQKQCYRIKSMSHFSQYKNVGILMLLISVVSLIALSYSLGICKYIQGPIFTLLWLIIGLVFVYGCFLISSHIKSKGLLSYVGKHSAEMILLQGIALSMLRNNVFTIENNYVYSGLSIIVMIILLIVGVPIYEKIKNMKFIK